MKQTVINKRDLEIILLEQKKEISSRADEKLCPREEESQIDLASPQAQVVIGVRRSGKSTLCFQALQGSGESFAYVDFDDERLAGLAAAQLNDVLEVLYKIYGSFKYLFLDEIQNVTDWPLFVNRLLRQKIHVVLTGSNAKLLSSDLATHLTGRSSEVALYPFSFAEFCEMKGSDTHTMTTEKIGLRRASFDDYMKQGGFPELLQIKDKKKYVSNLVDNILSRDIEHRYRISFKAGFEALAHHLLNVSPTVIVAKDLAETFGFKSVHTLRNYVKYLKQAYMLVGVKKYSAKSKVRVVQEKVYAVDVALMNQRDDAFVGDNLGWRLETVVLNHLIRRCKIEGTDVYYLKERNGECDFIVCRGNKALQCIQVSYDISKEKTRKRELNGLLLAAKSTGCDNLLLLTDHQYEDLEEAGKKIRIRPVYEWLLEN
ncbi:MAG: ATP-binding protein [Muribaculaceae bacterium]|nr:ATP-binding protein [Muribaculaceae bacterium]MCF0213947.1 ATP-binding protein [Muribaculaceae bacterium]MCF0214386.1 ATP-binding protein [Muribaculaceae bacterium]